MLDLEHSWLGNATPDIMTEEEYAVAMYARLGNVEVTAYQMNEYGVEDVVEELVEELFTLASIGLGALCCSVVV